MAADEDPMSFFEEGRG